MKGREPRDEGFALITALWAALILALLVSLAIKAGRTDARIARSAMRLAQLQALDDGAIALVQLELIGPRGSTGIPLDGSPFVLRFAAHDISVMVQDQAGLIDVNFAPGDQLRRLFHVVAELDDGAADTLADRVMDWREKGAGRRLNGAKAEDYAGLGYSYGPRQGPFESVAELRLVAGLTETVFDKVAPALTVYSQKPFLDPMVAPELVLRSLPEGSVDQAREAIEERIAKRERHEAEETDRLPILGRCLKIFASVREDEGTGAVTTRVVRLVGAIGEVPWTYSVD